MNNPIKILYFLNSTVRGGVEEHVLCLLRGLDRTRFRPVLVAPGRLLDKLADDLAPLKVRAYRVKIRHWLHLWGILKYLLILVWERPRIVHSHLTFATMFAAPLSKLAGVRRVVDTAHIREAWRQGIKKNYAVDRFIYRFVDRVIAVSHAVKRYLVEDKGLSAEKITVIHNGVDLTRFTVLPADRPRGPIAGDPTLAGSHLRFAVIGRLEPQKGHKYFIEAVGRMSPEVLCQARYLIVGEGALRDQLTGLAWGLGLCPYLVFLGFRSDVADIIAGCDCVVLPSLFEGLPLVLLEAGAMGKAVIATRVDGSPEVVEDGQTGFIVPAHDQYALQDAMEKFIKDPALLTVMGQNGRRRIEEHFDVKDQVQKTAELYEGLLIH